MVAAVDGLQMENKYISFVVKLIKSAHPVHEVCHRFVSVAAAHT